MILGMSVGVFTLLHVIITLVAIGSGLMVVGGMFASHKLPGTTAIFLLALTSGPDVDRLEKGRERIYLDLCVPITQTRAPAETATTVAAPRRSSQSPRGVRAIRTTTSSHDGQRRIAPSSMA